ncbi:MAG: hypothetical protein DRP13_00510 [Candidatus Aenigmatarchaeota archaeon]|nr:MAG: hypothetical protein DRP13_00510 [Candidatus Aenigmarchaeota archaeon]
MSDIFSILQAVWSYFISSLNIFIPQYILPNLQLILQIILILIVGFFVARLSKTVTVKLLTMAGLRKITIRTWTDDILKAVGYSGTLITLIGDLVKWFIYILVLGTIIEIAGFPGIFNIFSQIAIFVPRFIAAILIIVIGFLIADFFGKVFEEAGRRIFQDDFLSSFTGGLIKYSVAFVSIIISLALIGIDTFSLTVMLAIILTTAVIMLLMGVKDMFPNFTAGIYLKKNIKIGEHIKTGNYSGKVERIEPLAVVIKSGAKTVSIPSSFLIKNPVEKTKQ